MNDEPATKQDIAQLDARISQLDSSIAGRLESLETKLLTAFHDWARTYEVRVRGMSSLVVGFDERLSLVEERVARLERGGK